MRFTRHGALPYALALAMLCVSYLAYASSGQRSAPNPTAPRLHARTAALGAACRLPLGKQVEGGQGVRQDDAGLHARPMSQLPRQIQRPVRG